MSNTDRHVQSIDPDTSQLKTILRIRGTLLVKYSNGAYEFHMDCDALDPFHEVFEIELLDFPDDIDEAWDMAKKYRPGQIYSVEGELISEDQTPQILLPKLSEYKGKSMKHYFKAADCSSENAESVTDRVFTISGRINDLKIQKNKQNQHYLLMTLIERDDFHLVINPGLFVKYKEQILREDYLEYCGIGQEYLDCCDFSESNCSVNVLVVESISVP